MPYVLNCESASNSVIVRHTVIVIQNNIDINKSIDTNQHKTGVSFLKKISNMQAMLLSLALSKHTGTGQLQIRLL